ncbi:MAG: Macrolide export ATP-binding/permease protein MacB [Planctomycetes bacterium ADurb.Bin126]|nr:MAG: Macrolide export ATP-binding/permease protein MacB [Planctomycetes bacterium ADurb.Bin126]HOD83632.1 ABC transporter ATP-binding protein [Phycisphaerae bacterium]HQL72313.1 ABC transporter ATP-binding protein [Phycisphaerae bacterium]
MSEYLLEATELHKFYGKGASRVHVLRGLGMSVRRGEFVAVMGPSGCGKSTLLHVLGLMTPADAGRLVLGGDVIDYCGGNGESGRAASAEVPPAGPRVDEVLLRQWRRHRIGFVFQRFNLLGVLSGRDNVGISLQVRGLKMDERAEALFADLGVEHVMGRKPGQMSIGEQQRVAVVRALAHRPDLLLADEPTGNLDSENSRSLLDLLRRQNRTEGQTIVMITHSAEAAAAADRTIRMKDGRFYE